jgi:hypothetical protein
LQDRCREQGHPDTDDSVFDHDADLRNGCATTRSVHADVPPMQIP